LLWLLAARKKKLLLLLRHRSLRLLRLRLLLLRLTLLLRPLRLLLTLLLLLRLPLRLLRKPLRLLLLLLRLLRSNQPALEKTGLRAGFFSSGDLHVSSDARNVARGISDAGNGALESAPLYLDRIDG
jgi:hypothetical protein